MVCNMYFLEIMALVVNDAKEAYFTMGKVMPK